MNTLFGLGMPGGWEWIIIGLIVVIFFGANKIPEIFKGFGKGIREFKDASREIKKEIEKESDSSAKKKYQKGVCIKNRNGHETAKNGSYGGKEGWRR